MLDFTGQAVPAQNVDKSRLFEFSQSNQCPDGVGA